MTFCLQSVGPAASLRRHGDNVPGMSRRARRFDTLVPRASIQSENKSKSESGLCSGALALAASVATQSSTWECTMTWDACSTSVKAAASLSSQNYLVDVLHALAEAVWSPCSVVWQREPNVPRGSFLPAHTGLGEPGRDCPHSRHCHEPKFSICELPRQKEGGKRQRALLCFPFRDRCKLWHRAPTDPRAWPRVGNHYQGGEFSIGCP